MNRTPVALAIALAACTGSSQDIGASLASKVAAGGTAAIDLSPLGPPSWQRVCVLRPYTTNDTAALVLGFKWDAGSKTSIATNDGINVLVFVRGTEVVAYTEHPRSLGDLSKLEPQCLPRSGATVVRKADEQGWVYLVAPGTTDPAGLDR